MTIRTRFAPSPTGYLHIGGVRTALFNWLLTRRHNGQLILRIDDTDAERNRPEALQPILDGFQWLGIDWDEGPTKDGKGNVGPHAPYFQSQRNDSYVAAAMKLLESGHAYPDYSTKEETDADRVAQALAALKVKNPNPSAAEFDKERDAALQGKRPYIFRGALRDNDPADNVRRYREKPVALRFKVPKGRTVVLNDLIVGEVREETDLKGDPVILRVPDADGVPRPLYNFATVIDDAEMKITHVIRAREHLSNTWIQTLIFEALGFPLPQFAHVAVVNEPAPKPGAVYAPGVKPPNKNKKLSKRDMAKFVTPEIRVKLKAIGFSDADIESRNDLNPAAVAFYQVMGYLPAGVVNYLGRLGWSLDDKSEYIPLPEMIANFGLERVNDSPASFDPDKLYWLAGEYMRQLSTADKLEGCLPFLSRAGLVSEPADPATVEKVSGIIDASGERIKLFSDILTFATPMLRPLPDYDPAAVEKGLKPAAAVLRGFRDKVAAANPYDALTLEQALKEHAAGEGQKPNALVNATRVALTGVSVGFGLYETMVILGRDTTLRRIDHALTNYCR